MSDHTTLPQSLPLPDDLTGRTIDGRYRIRKRLGAGGMGQVYLAEDMKLDGAVALKRLSPQLHSDVDYRRALESEAQRAFELHASANVASLFNIFDSGEETFLVMEYVEGVSLRKRIREPLTVDEFLDIAIQCCEGLEAAHERRILHRDIKPANIMLTPAGTVKICDFGLARRLPIPSTTEAGARVADETAAVRSTTADGAAGSFAIAGTPLYMAPEVFAGDQPDSRADIFSLGVTFYELLARQNPFAGDTYGEVRNHVLHRAPPALSAFRAGVPTRLGRIIERMIEKDVDARPGSIGEVSRGLVRVKRRAESWLPHAIGGAVTVMGLMIVLILATTPQPAPASVQTLVQLPFEVSSGVGEDKPYADGLGEKLNEGLRIALEGSNVDVISAAAVGLRGIRSVEDAVGRLNADLVVSAVVSNPSTAPAVVYTLHDRSQEILYEGEAQFLNEDPGLILAGIVGDIVSYIEVDDRQRPVPQWNSAKGRAPEYFIRGIGHLGDPVDRAVDQAVYWLALAIEEDESYAAAHAALGMAYLRKYSLSQDAVAVQMAKEQCDVALQYAPVSADSHLCFGDWAIETGEYSLALGSFQTALSLDSSSPYAIRGLARTLAALGNSLAAEMTYRNQLSRYDLEWEDRSWIGRFYADRARFDEAVAVMEEELEFNPDNASAHRNLGGIHIQLGNYGVAVEFLSRAKDLAPEGSELLGSILSNLGVALFYERAYTDASEEFESAAGLRTYYVITANWARAVFHSGKPEQAAEIYRSAIQQAEAAVRVNANNFDAHIIAAQCYSMIGIHERALYHESQALAFQDDPEYFTIASIVHSRFGETEEAIDYLIEAIDRGASIHEIRAAPELVNLRDHPRFPDLRGR